MHVYIATVGKDTENLKKGFNVVGGIDKIYLLYSVNYKDAVDAVEELEPYFRAGKAEVVSVGVDGFDFQSIVDAIYRIYIAESDPKTRFSINITGGNNLMTAAACTSAFFIGATIYYLQNDPNKPVSEHLTTIPTPKTPNLSRLGTTSKRILKYILETTSENSPTCNKYIAEFFSIGKQDVKHHIDILEDEGLVQRTRGFKVQTDKGYRVNNSMTSISLTKQGMLVARWISL